MIETETDRDRQGQRQTVAERQTDRQADRQTSTDIHAQTETYISNLIAPGLPAAILGR